MHNREAFVITNVESFFSVVKQNVRCTNDLRALLKNKFYDKQLIKSRQEVLKPERD